MKNRKRLYFFFFVMMMLLGIAFAGCYDEVIVEDAKSIKFNNLNHRYIRFRDGRIYTDNYDNAVYSKVHSVGLMANSSDEHPAYGNPYANTAVDNDNNEGTATIDIYELKTHEISGEQWKGLGEYYILVELFAEPYVDYYLSRHKVRIKRAVTEIGFARNFIFVRRELL